MYAGCNWGGGGVAAVAVRPFRAETFSQIPYVTFCVVLYTVDHNPTVFPFGSNSFPNIFAKTAICGSDQYNSPVAAAVAAADASSLFGLFGC